MQSKEPMSHMDPCMPTIPPSYLQAWLGFATIVALTFWCGFKRQPANVEPNWGLLKGPGSSRGFWWVPTSVQDTTFQRIWGREDLPRYTGEVARTSPMICTSAPAAFLFVSLFFGGGARQETGPKWGGTYEVVRAVVWSW